MGLALFCFLSCEVDSVADPVGFTLCGSLKCSYLTLQSGVSGEVLKGNDFDVRVYTIAGRAIKQFDRGDFDWILLKGTTYMLEFHPPAKGRYVKILKRSPLLALCEVQVLINLQGKCTRVYLYCFKCKSCVVCNSNNNKIYQSFTYSNYFFLFSSGYHCNVIYVCFSMYYRLSAIGHRVFISGFFPTKNDNCSNCLYLDTRRPQVNTKQAYST